MRYDAIFLDIDRTLLWVDLDVEGYVEDLASGRVPNVFAERGWKAEWRHNRRSLVTRVAVGAFIAGTAFAVLRGRKGNSRPRR